MARLTVTRRGLLGVLAFGAAVTPALAVDYNWDAAVNGTFGDPLRWNPLTGPPGAATFPAPSVAPPSAARGRHT